MFSRCCDSCRMISRLQFQFRPVAILAFAWLCLGALNPATAADYNQLPSNTTHAHALTLRLEKLESLLAKASDYQRYILLDTAARTALELERYPQAADYARELLALAANYPNDWNHAAALHYAHIALGRAALSSNDIAGAKQQLLAAANIPASDILNRNGPDLQLASRLLARGERETVSIYLKACASFWPRGQKKIGHWVQQLSQGESPELLALP